MTRLVAAVAAVAVVAVGVTGIVVLTGDDGDGGGGGGTPVARSSDGSWTPAREGADFKEPEQILRPEGDGPKVIKVDLNAVRGPTPITGSDVNTQTYNTQFVGPTIHAQPGDTISVTFNNDLRGKDGTDDPEHPVYTNIHYHGLHVDPEGTSDNIFRTFKPKASGENPYASAVKLKENQPVGTYWYHAHFHGISDGQVLGGMSGLIMLDGLRDRLGEDFKDVKERQVTLRDVQISADKVGDEFAMSSTNQEILVDPKQTFRTVNGQYKPKLGVKTGEYELWHLANIGADVYYRVALAKQKLPRQEPLEDKQAFYIVAEDGVPVWDVVARSELLIPPGKRFDVLVKAEAAGTYELLALPYQQTSNPGLSQVRLIPCVPGDPDTWPNCVPEVQLLATVTAAGDPPADSPKPPAKVIDKDDPQDPTSNDLTDDKVDNEATFAFDYPEGSPFEPVIYKEPLDPDTDANKRTKIFKITQDPIIAPVLGTTDEWTLVNKTRDDHPFHIHVNGFQVTQTNEYSKNGDLEPYPARGHQDVVNVPRAKLFDTDNDPATDPVKVNGRVVIRQHYADFDGWYVFHCHILFHEDAGMMRTIQVRADADVEIEPPPEADDPEHQHP